MMMHSDHSSLESDCVQAIIGALPSNTQTIIMHSAFSGLSKQGLEANTFLEQFINQLDQKTLLMPTMTWRTVDADHPFDQKDTPSHTGILTELFRQKFADYRSLHPTHSMAGFGLLCHELLIDHHKPISSHLTPCSLLSPYGKLFENYADDSVAIVLLGVNLEVCTAIHLAEELIASEYYLRPVDQSECITVFPASGPKFTVLNQRHNKKRRHFEQFRSYLLTKASTRSLDFSKTPIFVFTLHALIDHVIGCLQKIPEATLRSDSNF